MFNRKEARLRRARKTRAKIAELKAVRLCVNRTNCHIYAQIISPCGSKVLASASTLETGVRKDVPNGGNKAAATSVGKLIAERANAAGRGQQLGKHLGIGLAVGVECPQRQDQNEDAEDEGRHG